MPTWTCKGGGSHLHLLEGPVCVCHNRQQWPWASLAKEEEGSSCVIRGYLMAVGYSLQREITESRWLIYPLPENTGINCCCPNRLTSLWCAFWRLPGRQLWGRSLLLQGGGKRKRKSSTVIPSGLVGPFRAGCGNNCKFLFVKACGFMCGRLPCCKNPDHRLFWVWRRVKTLAWIRGWGILFVKLSTASEIWDINKIRIQGENGTWGALWSNLAVTEEKWMNHLDHVNCHLYCSRMMSQSRVWQIYVGI